MDLAGKNALVTGVANNRSIAWGVAKSLAQRGAEVCVTCQGERLRDKILRIQDGFVPHQIYCCDVRERHQLARLYDEVSERWQHLDVLVHSMAFAPLSAWENRISQISRDDFITTFEISVYSFLSLVNAFEDFLHEGQASVLTLTYIGSRRVIPGYGIMGPAKAALESCVRYLAYDLGARRIRVNAISAGPVKTLASSAFENFNRALEMVEERTPLHANVAVEDIGELAAFLASDRARMITGRTHYVDSGASIMGA